MALRAMYKGIKKVLAPLIINRPGELAIDQDALNAELNTVFFPRSEQTVLGAKNLCSNIPTFTLLKSGDRTKNNTINETPNIGTYKVSFTISDAANITKQGGLQLGDNAGNWSANPDGAFDVVNGRVVLTIPFDHAVSKVYVFLNANDGDTATATFSDFMITFATDPDSTFVPQVLTNKELTEKVKTENVTGVTWTAAATAKDFNIAIQGNVICIRGYINPTEAVAAWGEVVTGLPKPMIGAYMSDTKTNGAFSIEASGNVGHMIAATALSAGTQYTFAFTYLAAD